MDEEKPVGPLIVGNFEIAMQLSQNRTIKISGYVYNNEDNVAVDKRMDGAMDALDRQFIRVDLTNKEARIAMLTEAIENTGKEFQALVDLKRQLAEKGKSLPSTQKQKIEQHDLTVRGFNAEIESLKAAVKAGRQKINGVLAA